jgi:hypothetical protein
MKNVFIFLIIILAASCNKSDIELSYAKGLTVEAFIDNDKQARVYLTKSFPIDGTIDSVALMRNIESHAKVTVSNGEISEILSLKRDDSRYPMLYYRSNKLVGKAGDIFTLQIDLGGKSYFSNTEVPENSIINNFEFISVPNQVPDIIRELTISVDNTKPEVKKYFKLLIKNEKIESKYSFASPAIFTNETTTQNEFDVFVKYPESYDYDFIKGEEFFIKLQRITKQEYDFWKSIKGDETRLLNMKSFSEEIPSNIDDAFGYWGGQNTSSYRVVVD